MIQTTVPLFLLNKVGARLKKIQTDTRSPTYLDVVDRPWLLQESSIVAAMLASEI
jgi:hypothetical protein